MTEPLNTNTGAGALLRAARESQGLHIAALAAAIKVAPRKLDALENDRWHELPDATFTRALAQTVCRTLKIDARPILALLPPAGAVALEVTSGGLNEPFHERPGRADPGLGVRAIRPMVWTAALLMVAAMVVYLAPAGWWVLPTAAPAIAAAPAAASAAVAPASAAATAVAPAGVELRGQVAAAAAPAVPSTGETVLMAPPPTASSAAPMAAGLVHLRTSEASWMEVRDARGQILLSRTVQPGESVGLDGALPIRLTIGNAAATQLAFRGMAVDLAARTRDNVARVELQ
jgi:cytoskeleton protein RodZ